MGSGRPILAIVPDNGAAAAELRRFDGVWLADPDDAITVWGSLQCPYYVHKALMTLFSLPSHKVRVMQMETGGGFGGKEE